MPTLDEIAERMSRVEQTVDELRDALADERVQTASVVARVDAHEIRGQERHAEVLGAISAIREDSRAMLASILEREQQRVEVAGRIGLAIVGLGSTLAAGYYGLH